MKKSITSFEFIQRFIHPINGGYKLKWCPLEKCIALFHNDKYVKDIVFNKICELLYAYDIDVGLKGNAIENIIYTF